MSVRWRSARLPLALNHGSLVELFRDSLVISDALSPHRKRHAPSRRPAGGDRCGSGRVRAGRRHGRRANRARRDARRHRGGHCLSLLPRQDRSGRGAARGNFGARDCSAPPRRRCRARSAVRALGHDHDVCRACAPRPPAHLRGDRRTGRCRARRRAAQIPQSAGRRVRIAYCGCKCRRPFARSGFGAGCGGLARPPD